MAHLVPIPFAALARRMFRELDEKQAVFDLPARRFVRGHPDLDLSATLGGKRVAIPFGPAAGPHTQLAPNLVLSWLAGGRVLELKTVQDDDALVLPRPCIDVREAGFNCEFSQELRVEQSLEEYVKGALLVAMLAESGAAGVAPDDRSTVFDASVGYDLRGVRGDKVDGYLRALRDVRPIVARLRGELPKDLAGRFVEIDPVLVDTVTLSTFHGCPPHEIEAIAEHLLTAHGLSVVVKLNPTLLGAKDLGALLNDALGHRDLVVPARAFAEDPTFDQAMGMAARLAARAASLGLRFGVKLTNTLIVENRRPHLPAAETYLSGAPLHVLASHLVARVRAALPELPLSFSAGIDAHNLADALALDLVPVTVCTDWLKTGGYGRGVRMAEALHDRLVAVGAKTLAGWILLAHGHAEAALGDVGVAGPDAAAALDRLRATGAPPSAPFATRWVAAAARRNTTTYVERLAREPRYDQAHAPRPPRKVGTALHTFDCLTCDKCVAVCPNDAVFTYVAPHVEVAETRVEERDGRLVSSRTGTLHVDERHQIATFADACNDCGNCDAFCPEDGGPNRAKPRLFGSLAALRADPHGDGLYVERTPSGHRTVHRAAGDEMVIEAIYGALRVSGDGYELAFELSDPEGPVHGHARVAVDLTRARVAHLVAKSVLGAREINAVTTREGPP
ncbi:MAG: glutamate synthase [Verrucomicrobia bacterium]|nr:glutamate synthase [Verrucomicrobiota bacterium]